MEQKRHDKLEAAFIILLITVMVISLTGCTITTIHEPTDFNKIEGWRQTD